MFYSPHILWLFIWCEIPGSKDICNCNSWNFINDPSTCIYEEVEQLDNFTGCTPSVMDNTSSSFCCDTFPDSITNYLSPRCADMLQGSHRLQRGLLYIAYLENVLWAHFNYSAKWELATNMTHNRTAFFSSTAFQKWAVFDDETKISLSDSNDNKSDNILLYIMSMSWQIRSAVVIILMIAVLVVYQCRQYQKRATASFVWDDTEVVWLADLSCRGSDSNEVMMTTTNKCRRSHSVRGSKYTNNGLHEQDEFVGLMVSVDELTDSSAFY